ncbi:MAG: GFA family protein [Deltaproteobacteria bacterium]|nr:GFA family protein [Deltaproteobacteria bacterium]
MPDPGPDAHVTHRGGCHCGAVRFEVDAPARLSTLACNCSRCTMLGFRHLIVPKVRFRLLAGEDDLTEYRFNAGVARHLFCRTCGVQSYYVPRSNPDGISVNARCLDPVTIEGEDVSPFDGQNWEEHARGLAHLSE